MGRFGAKKCLRLFVTLEWGIVFLVNGCNSYPWNKISGQRNRRHCCPRQMHQLKKSRKGHVTDNWIIQIWFRKIRFWQTRHSPMNDLLLLHWSLWIFFMGAAHRINKWSMRSVASKANIRERSSYLIHKLIKGRQFLPHKSTSTKQARERAWTWFCAPWKSQSSVGEIPCLCVRLPGKKVNLPERNSHRDRTEHSKQKKKSCEMSSEFEKVSMNWKWYNKSAVRAIHFAPDEETGMAVYVLGAISFFRPPLWNGIRFSQIYETTKEQWLFVLAALNKELLPQFALRVPSSLQLNVTRQVFILCSSNKFEFPSESSELLSTALAGLSHPQVSLPPQRGKLEAQAYHTPGQLKEPINRKNILMRHWL